MNLLIAFLLWCLLWVVCWPVALGLLLIAPLLWLLSLPFRLVGVVIGAMFALLRAVLYLPARLLGHKP